VERSSIGDINSRIISDHDAHNRFLPYKIKSLGTMSKPKSTEDEDED